jgi:hypothetical protein
LGKEITGELLHLALPQLAVVAAVLTVLELILVIGVGVLEVRV